jgi:hypothetical protein
MHYRGKIDAIASSMQALHVGCESSTVGEFLVQEMGFGKVVNVDRDEETMGQMEERWRDIVAQQKKDGLATLQLSKMEFVTMDFTKEHLPAKYKNTFDLVLDKGTLDCILCSDIATSSMLLQIYCTLKEAGGVYMVFSFTIWIYRVPSGLLSISPWDEERSNLPAVVNILDVGKRQVSGKTCLCGVKAFECVDLPLTGRCCTRQK